MAGVWEELRMTGALGTAGVILVYETVDAVRRFNRYPPPKGLGSWTRSAVEEFAHDFLFAKGGPARLAKIVATATDEESFERVLQTAIRNEFRKQARQTETGAAMRSLAGVVERDPDIVVARAAEIRTWSLIEYEGNEPYSGSDAPLIEVAYAVPDVRRARWSPMSTHRPPIAETDSLRRVLRAVLAYARAPVAARTVFDVVLERFPLITSGEVEFRDNVLATVSPSAESALLAEEAWGQLKDNERLVIGLLDRPVREIADLTGLSRSTAQRSVTAARKLLAGFLVDTDNPTGVVKALAGACAALLARGTAQAGSASVIEQEN